MSKNKRLSRIRSAHIALIVASDTESDSADMEIDSAESSYLPSLDRGEDSDGSPRDLAQIFAY